MKSNRSNRQLELALRYATGGTPVFPANARTKRPLTEHGHLEVTTDPVQIRAWWAHRPDALVAIPTGHSSGLWVLDVDGEAGRTGLRHLLARLGIARPAGLSNVNVETPSDGSHSFFALRAGERPRTRASDIAPGLDTRGEGGYIIAPGNRLPDGRQYRLIGVARDLFDASPAPRELVYLATFNARERAEIAADDKLREAIRVAEPADWPGILEAHRQAKAERIASRMGATSPDSMRRQALHDLREASEAYTGLRDGRRNGLFSVACRLVRYVVNGVLTENELRTDLRNAAAANGALGANGSAWFDGVIRRALAFGARDSLPPLARRFRERT